MHKAVYHGVKAIYMKVRTGLKGYQEVTTTAICTGPPTAGSGAARSGASRTTTRRATTRRDPGPARPGRPRSGPRARSCGRRAPATARRGRGAQRRSSPTWTSAGRACRGSRGRRRSGPRLNKRRNPSCGRRRARAADARRRRAASAPAGRRRRRAKVQLLEPLPTVPQDAKVSNRGPRRRARGRPTPAALRVVRKLPADAATLRAAGDGRRTVDGLRRLDSLLSWQPGLFLQPSLDIHRLVAGVRKARTTGRSGGARATTRRRASSRRDRPAGPRRHRGGGDEPRRRATASSYCGRTSREPGWVFATCGDDCGYVPSELAFVPRRRPCRTSSGRRRLSQRRRFVGCAMLCTCNSRDRPEAQMAA